MAFRDDLIDDGRVDRAVDVAQQQRPRVAIAESADLQRGQAGQHVVSDPGARRAHQRDPVGRRTGAQPEHGRERVALRDRKLVEVVEQGNAQLMQAAVGQFHLRLHPYGRRDPPPTSPSRLAGDLAVQVAQQSALAHARLAAQDEDATRTREHVGREPVERGTLVTTSEQLTHCTTP